MVAIGNWWRLILFAATFLMISCTGTVGEDAPSDDIELPDVGAAETQVGTDTGFTLDSHDDEVSSVPDVVADLHVGPQTTGCIQCHTDKDRLFELAPPEEPSEEEESGGG